MVVLIHNDKKWAKALEQEYGIKVLFLEIPENNAYKKLDEIEKKIYKADPDKLIKILISAGPMAKVLAYRLSQKGYTVYDTGHCFDKPLKLKPSKNDII